MADKKKKVKKQEYKQKKQKQNNRRHRYTVVDPDLLKDNQGKIPWIAAGVLVILAAFIGIMVSIGSGRDNDNKEASESALSSTVVTSVIEAELQEEADTGESGINNGLKPDEFKPAAEETDSFAESDNKESDNQESDNKEADNKEGGDSDTGSSNTGDTGSSPVTYSPLEVHFIDIGQGDSILVTCGGESMLIDGGNEYKGTTVQKYLVNHGTDSFKYIVASHPDADHIGGLDVIVTKYDIETANVWMPDVIKDTPSYYELLDAIKYRNYTHKAPEIGEDYYLGDAVINAYYLTDESLDDNDRSIVIKVSHGDNSFLFTGDISTTAEHKLAGFYNLKADVLKVAHHGSGHSTGDEFIKAVEPEHAVFSVGENVYGHPDYSVAERLNRQNVNLYRTDLQGSIIFTSDGNSITVNTSPMDISLFMPVVQEPKELEPTVRYILNTNTGVFHYPHCNSVKKMKEKNKLPTSKTRDECIADGYRPCGNCNP